MGPATGLTCPHSLVADGPLEADALLALKEALRVDLGLDRLELREAVRAPDVLLHRDALLLALGVREFGGAVGGVVVLERTERVAADVVVFRASEELAFRGLRVERGDLGEEIFARIRKPFTKALNFSSGLKSTAKWLALEPAEYATLLPEIVQIQ